MRSVLGSWYCVHAPAASSLKVSPSPENHTPTDPSPAHRDQSRSRDERHLDTAGAKSDCGRTMEDASDATSAPVSSSSEAMLKDCGPEAVLAICRCSSLAVSLKTGGAAFGFGTFCKDAKEGQGFSPTTEG